MISIRPSERAWMRSSPRAARSSPASAIASIRSIPALLACSRLSDEARAKGTVAGRFADIGRAVEAEMDLNGRGRLVFR